MATFGDSLRLPAGPVDLTALDARSTPGFDGDKGDGQKALEALAIELADLQERLFAAARAAGDRRRLLLLLQGMDTAGKGGTIRKVAGLVDPQGLDITAFKAPTPEELEQDFLWRIDRALPRAGQIGVFDRSQYEDVLIARVRGLAPAEEIERRYGAINAFERDFVASGGTLVKVCLHIDAEIQAERLDDPAKHWKYNPGDLDERELWPDYREAYEIALERCNTEQAPWFVVPAGRKWYRNLAVAGLLVEHLRDLDLAWPEADFDVAAERARLAAMR